MANSKITSQSLYATVPIDHGRQSDFRISRVTPLLGQTEAGRRKEGKPMLSQPKGGRSITSQPHQTT